MTISDAVIGNLTTIYVAVIAAMKAYGLVCGRSYSTLFVLLLSTGVVCLLLIATLAWDLSRKATCSVIRRHHHHHHQHYYNHSCNRVVHDGGEMCKGGICWHGVAVRSPASQVRFRLPPSLS